MENSRSKLGFLGLGIMGYPMARHLLKAGPRVALWSNTCKARRTILPRKAKALLARRRAMWQRSPTSFSIASAIAPWRRQSRLALAGLIEGVREGSIIGDCSTISPAASREIGEAFAAKERHFLDSPCTGSKPGAEKATLTFMIGGDQAVFERAKPYFEIMGKLFYYCGAAGQGLQAKLTQNLVLANIMQAFAEGMVLATKGGIAPELMLDILDNSAAKSGLISYKAPFILARDFKLISPPSGWR